MSVSPCLKVTYAGHGGALFVLISDQSRTPVIEYKSGVCEEQEKSPAITGVNIYGGVDLTLPKLLLPSGSLFNYTIPGLVKVVGRQSNSTPKSRLRLNIKCQECQLRIMMFKHGHRCFIESHVNLR